MDSDNMGIPLFTKPNSLAQNNTAMASPTTPVTTEKYKTERVCEGPSREIIDLVDETAPLEQFSSNQVEPFEKNAVANPLEELVVQQANGENQEDIDLNKTPQKKARRKKHRPKVIQEGKPKRTRKKETPIALKPPENPSGKRKYVRRKKDEKLQETPSCALGASGDLNNQTRNKSVRRSLNFDLEDSQAIYRPSETQAREAHVSALHAMASGGGFENDNVRVPQTQDPFANANVRVPQTQNQCAYENVRIPQTQTQFGNDNVRVPQTPNQPPLLSRNDRVRIPETPNQAPQLSRNENVRVPCTPNHPPHLSRNDSERVLQTPNQPSQLSRNENVRVLRTLNQTPQLSRNENVRVPQTPNQPPQLSSLEMTKMRWRDDFAKMVFNMTPAPQPAEKVSENPKRAVTKIDSQNISEVGGAKSNKILDVLPQGTKRVCNLVDGAQVPSFGDIRKKRRIETGQRELPSNAFSTPNRNSPSRQNTRKGSFAEAGKLRALEKWQSLNRILVVNQVVREASEIKIQAHTPITYGNNVDERDQVSTPTKRDCDQPSTPEKSLEYSYGPRSRVETLISYQTKQEARSRKRKEHNTLNANQLVPYRDPMDEIVTKLLNLDINTEVMNEVQNALIPYGVGDGTMVLIKKRKPRAKVDLDPESHKVWRLLMGLERSEGAEGTDMDKERWWEEERRIFRGRADSFIARMHLIQGDRTFSPWKGSVVDSVIGVFLTQNVSDHLSSSAFMCLAARFPPKSKANNIAANVETIHKPLVSEPEFCEQSLSGINESLEKESSSDFHELDRGIDHESPDSVLGTAVHVASCAIEEDRVLSQNSSSRCPVQRTNENKLSPSLNFEADELFRRGRANGFNSFTELLKMANDRVLIDLNVASNAKRSSQEYGGGIDWAAVLRVNSRTDSAPSAIELHEKNINDACRSSKNTAQPFQFENHYHCHIESSLKGNASSVAVETHVKIQNSINPPTCPNSTNDNRRNDAVDVGAAESNLRNEAQKGSAETLNNELKSKKVKSEAEKKPAIDWDCLRKQVHQNSVRKERNSNAMDSLDYEALLNADVSEISNTIRERGMNNLLAERIKAFLDRLVRDHGSIDLEWLRDVPPDKAKDYLLSIRGLGLKSVECVRLLTLHHLAFPVDTNVGRIAVRLGWVPLQPLPESLQLHLLEMYPVMETIQKYLWPRLCKLDQQKLYELHYQLITFGKVFCTKSKPNCNACPMRAECKHFASAYASARLALPGPEEKHIVTSEIPFASEVRNSIPNPMPLPQLEGNTFSQEQTIPINCEPIIEEPATPEPECIETTEIDIEDAFYNDPDEIPTIKLNFEEFTQNLQNYMQENNLGLQDGDMSKALVAITPEAASIPAPKLKNVNRLRTEHQVYELPDGHPLLEGMDKREPDDPCPYLLAIWTPGETAQSTEAPKSCCNSQGPVKLCDMSTCFSCNSIREAQNQTVRGTILIPCRTANRGSFPLNGTYFQVNEVFADHDSSCNPIDVPRDWIWKLARRTVYFGTSMPSIFKGLTTEGIQHCFWRGFVCVRGFDRTTRAPKPLFARLHFPASKSPRNRKTTTAAAAATPQQQG